MRIYELLEDDKFYFIVSEFIKFGELYDYVVKRSDSNLGPMTENEVKIVARQLLYALNYMHKRNIAHRDIKPENVLIDSIDGDGLTIKITDFGFASYFNNVDKLDEVLGSPLYMPPEIIHGQKYDSNVDVWSACIVIYIMMCGKPPFFGLDKEEVYKNITNMEVPFPSDSWRSVSENAK